MPSIRRDYWNENIKEVTSIPTDASWIKTHIEGHDYYGRSLKGKHLEKCKIVVGKIIPLFALSIALAPISIPVLFAMGKYRELGVSIREIHYNTKIECILNLSKANLNNTKAPTQDSPNPGIVDPFPLNHPHADEMLIPKMFVDPSIADSEEAAQFIRLLSQVSKSFTPIVNETIKSLVNSGKLLLKDVPGINTKDDAFNYIQGWDDLSHLDLSGLGDVTDSDISALIKKWPNLKALTIEATALSEGSMDDIIKLTHLNKLHIYEYWHPELPNLDTLTELKDLSVTGYFHKIPFTDLPNLEKVKLAGSSKLFPPLEKMPLLKEFSLKFSEVGKFDFSKLNLINDLEKLELKGVDDTSTISLDSFTHLKVLELEGSFNQLPDISQLTALEELTISAHFLRAIPLDSLDKMTQLKYLTLTSSLQDFPPLDQLPYLKELALTLTYDSNLPSLSSLAHLEKLTIYSNDLEALPSDYFNDLINLKTLIIDGNGSFNLTIPNLGKLTALENLNIINKKVPDIQNLPNLKSVTFNNKKIK